jgi:hypothetical protein
LGDADDERIFRVEANGTWAARTRALRSALAPWLDDAGSPAC